VTVAYRVTWIAVLLSVGGGAYALKLCAPDGQAASTAGWFLWISWPAALLAMVAWKVRATTAHVILAVGATLLAAAWLLVAVDTARHAPHACLQIGWIFLLGPIVLGSGAGVAALVALLVHFANRKASGAEPPTSI